MKTINKNTVISAGAGLAVGIVNGLLGAGGGIIAVPLLRKMGLERKASHANAVAVILPITALSAAIYLLRGYVSLNDAYIYLPGGIAGAFLGTVIMRRISPFWLKRIFGIFMVYAGVRLLLR